MAKQRTKVEGVKKEPIAKVTATLDVEELGKASNLPLSISKRYRNDAMTVIKSGFDSVLTSKAASREALDAVVESGLDVVDLIPWNAAPHNRYGYDESDIRHTEDTWTVVESLGMTSILDQPDKGVYVDVEMPLRLLASLFGKTGKTPQALLALVMDKTGVLTEDVETIIPGFTAVWGNGQWGYAGVLKSYEDLIKRARTNITRMRNELATRTEVVFGMTPTMVNGVLVDHPGNIDQIINPVVRQFKADEKERKTIEAKEKALELASTPEGMKIHALLTAIVEGMSGKADNPAVGDMNVISRDRVNASLNIALAACKGARRLTEADIAKAEAKAEEVKEEAKAKAKATK